MCCLLSCFGFMLDYIQRAITLLLACLLCSIFCLGVIVAIVAGVAYGYNYSMAEWLTYKRTDTTVYLTRGKFYDTIYPMAGESDFHYALRRGQQAQISHDASKMVVDGQPILRSPESVPKGWVQIHDTAKHKDTLTKIKYNSKKVVNPAVKILEQLSVEVVSLPSTLLDEFDIMVKSSRAPPVTKTMWKTELISRTFKPNKAVMYLPSVLPTRVIALTRSSTPSNENLRSLPILPTRLIALTRSSTPSNENLRSQPIPPTRLIPLTRSSTPSDENLGSPPAPPTRLEHLSEIPLKSILLNKISTMVKSSRAPPATGTVWKTMEIISRTFEPNKAVVYSPSALGVIPLIRSSSPSNENPEVVTLLEYQRPTKPPKSSRAPTVTETLKRTTELVLRTFKPIKEVAFSPSALEVVYPEVIPLARFNTPNNEKPVVETLLEYQRPTKPSNQSKIKSAPNSAASIGNEHNEPIMSYWYPGMPTLNKNTEREETGKLLDTDIDVDDEENVTYKPV